MNLRQATSRALARIQNAVAPVEKAAEGDYRDGPYWLSVSGGWLPANSEMNFWQYGQNVQGGYSRSAMVEACVSAYSQTCAMLPGDHWKGRDDGGRDRIDNSALCRILRGPNTYQTMSDFLLNAVRNLYLDGNAYALALRNDRFEITEMHLMNSRQCQAMIAPTGDIFYALGGNEVIDYRLAMMGQALAFVPARDVWHVKLQTPRSPLRGESPIMAAALDIAAGDAITQQQIAFFLNQAKPATVLTTDLVLDKDQVQALRDRWNEQTRGLGAGGTPILTAGLKAQTLTMTARDAQLADIIKASENHIALAFRVPLQLLGLGGSPFGSTEALMQSWIASGLGFCINHIEEAFGRLFQLRGLPWDYVEFDTQALLRSAHAQRIAALVQGVQGGVYSPNEARNLEGLPTVKFGDEPRVQQQVVPLSAAAQITAIPAPKPPSAAPPAAAAAKPSAATQGAKNVRIRNRDRLLARARKFDADELSRRRAV